MLGNLVNNKQLPFARVLMDSWYTSQKLMAMIYNLGNIYYCPLKKNRLVDDTMGGEKYKQIEKVQWTESEVLSEKLIKIKNFPADKKVKLFRVTVSANRRSYVVTNDRNQSDITDVRKICSPRGENRIISS